MSISLRALAGSPLYGNTLESLGCLKRVGFPLSHFELTAYPE